jgi:hypothetical protein
MHVYGPLKGPIISLLKMLNLFSQDRIRYIYPYQILVYYTATADANKDFLKEFKQLCRLVYVDFVLLLTKMKKLLFVFLFFILILRNNKI